MNAGPLQCEVKIRPGSRWVDFDLGSLWQYRDLVVLLVQRDFSTKYSQTLLGPLWFIVQPLVTTVLFTLVFSGVAKISTNGTPALLFYLCGLLPWTYFANTFTGCAQTLTANAGLFGKVYFPRLVIPISIAASNLFAVAIHLILLLVVYAVLYAKGVAGVPHPSWKVCLLPLILLQVASLAIGAGLWMSALTTKYRDFTHVSGLLINVWFYATPVLFPLSIVPDKMKVFTIINPMSFIEEATRKVILDNGMIDGTYAAVSIGTSLLLFASGVIAFQYCQRTFIDTV